MRVRWRVMDQPFGARRALVLVRAWCAALQRGQREPKGMRAGQSKQRCAIEVRVAWVLPLVQSGCVLRLRVGYPDQVVSVVVASSTVG